MGFNEMIMFVVEHSDYNYKDIKRILRTTGGHRKVATICSAVKYNLEVK